MLMSENVWRGVFLCHFHPVNLIFNGEVHGQVRSFFCSLIPCCCRLAYWIWFWFSRALNGSPLLGHDFRVFFDLSLTLPFFALGVALSKAERIRFLDWLSAVIGGFYFIIGLIALVAFLRRSMYEIPILDGKIGIIREAGYARINFFEHHPNVTGYWFLIALFLMIYQFFHCEKKLWRIPILLSAVLDLIMIAVTYSRSVRLCMALAFSLLAAMLLLQVLHHKPRFLRMVLAFAAAGFVLIAAYEGSGLCADIMATLSYDIADMHTASGPAEQKAARVESCISVRPMPLSSGKGEAPAAVELAGGLVQSDPRPKSGDLNKLSSDRILIWRVAFQAIGKMPSVLWRGRMCDDVMTAPDGMDWSGVPAGQPVNYHNALIQVLMTVGLPGLMLAVSFLILVFWKGFRLLFSGKLPLDDRVLVLPVVTVLPRIMIEAYLFTSTNIRTLFFFLMCGILIGLTREHRSLEARRG